MSLKLISWGNFFIIFLGVTFLLGGCSKPIGGINENYRPPEYDPNKSIIYRKSYKDLKHELLYARITVPDGKGGHQTVRKINDKVRLIEIVQEFDKLISTNPKEKSPTRLESTFYVVIMWREGRSVSYVILESNDEFYYEQSNHLLKRKMPDSLLQLLEFK